MRGYALVGLLLLIAPVVVQADEANATSPRPLTVVAVIDAGFSPYHYDFLGSQHPWNRDADPTNDFDFHADPATYIAGYPSATPLAITLPAGASTNVDTLRTADAGVWGTLPSSTLANVHMKWIPGTKVIGALRFGSTFQGSNSAHGTRSAASAAGNWHGTCQECVFVLISGMTADALRWASSQPWIDVITNSYGHSSVSGYRDNIYFGAPVAQTGRASDDGQVIVFSAGNGLQNDFGIPMFTYWSSEKGPDWMVTVGAVQPGTEQTYSGAGKPVDVSSIGSSYPSTGGSTANGTGTHSGTSNAAPTVAGYFAKTLQVARETLGDHTPGHANGIVATGTPYACGPANPQCVLSDGILTRRELQDTVFHNVLPSPTRVTVPSYPPLWPTTPAAFHYQGHGTFTGRYEGENEYQREIGRILDAAHGFKLDEPRPLGERGWFIADSACRQKLWGTWSGGYYTSGVPEFDPTQDAAGIALWTACQALPPNTWETIV